MKSKREFEVGDKIYWGLNNACTGIVIGLKPLETASVLVEWTYTGHKNPPRAYYNHNLLVLIAPNGIDRVLNSLGE